MIVYPDDATVVRYEYAGAYLQKVCEVADAGTPDCTAPVESYVEDVAYDDLGRRTLVATPAGDRTFSYSSTNQRLTQDAFTGNSEAGSYARVLNYDAYDEIGNIRTITDTGSSPDALDFDAVYTYDTRNRLESWARPNEVEATQYFGYDALGNLIHHGTPDLAASSQNQIFDETETDRPHAISSSTTLGLDYAYDADGNLLSEIGASGQRHFTFDSDNRLRCIGTTPGMCQTMYVTYDAAGMRLWDWRPASGGMTSNTERIYVDDLVTLQIIHASEVLESITLHIEAFGEEIARKQIVPVTLRTSSVWPAGWHVQPPPAELLAAIAMLGCGGLILLGARIRWADAALERPGYAVSAGCLVILLVIPPLPSRAGGGGSETLRRWLVSDHIGSANVVIGPDGAVEGQVTFSPFGQVATAAGAGSDVFAGHRRDGTVGLTYMRARWQNPSTGVFISVDPLVPMYADPQFFNGFGYARNNPIELIDPKGESPIEEYVVYAPSGPPATYAVVAPAVALAAEFAAVATATAASWLTMSGWSSGFNTTQNNNSDSNGSNGDGEGDAESAEDPAAEPAVDVPIWEPYDPLEGTHEEIQQPGPMRVPGEGVSDRPAPRTAIGKVIELVRARWSVRLESHRAEENSAVNRAAREMAADVAVLWDSICSSVARARPKRLEAALRHFGTHACEGPGYR